MNQLFKQNTQIRIFNIHLYLLSFVILILSNTHIQAQTPVVLSNLPETNGTGDTTPGIPEVNNGELTGTGVGENDLNASDSVKVTGAGKPTISKTGDANLQILETTTMTLSVDIAVGTTYGTSCR